MFQNLALTIQRKMAENLAIAKAREDAVSFNSLPTEFRLLIFFANSVNPDQARQNVGPDLVLNCLTLQGYFQPFWEGALGPFALGNFWYFN